jgi:ribosomal protein L7/L12
MVKSEISASRPTVRQWIGRVGVPLALALFAALMCAGPGSVTVPGTMQLASPLVCPAGTSLQQIEQPGNDNGEAVVYVSLKCVGAAGSSAASVTGVFAVLAGIYFVIFGILAVAAVALFVRRATRPSGPTARPLSADGRQQVQAQLAQGQKLEAIRLVQQFTGSGLAEAKDIVDKLATPETRDRAGG